MEEVLEVDLVLGEGRRAVGAVHLDQPARQVHAHLLVLEVVERELLLARLQDVPQVLHPHLPPALPPLLPPDRTRTRRRTSTAAVTPNFKFRFAFLSLQTPNSNLQNAL